MAITDKKGINVTSGFKLISPAPIDARYVVEDETELQSIIDNGAAYNGLEVWVNNLGKKKQYNGTEFVEVQAGGGVSEEVIGDINAVLDEINGGGTIGSSGTEVEIEFSIAHMEGTLIAFKLTALNNLPTLDYSKIKRAYIIVGENENYIKSDLYFSYLNFQGLGTPMFQKIYIDYSNNTEQISFVQVAPSEDNSLTIWYLIATYALNDAISMVLQTSNKCKLIFEM